MVESRYSDRELKGQTVQKGYFTPRAMAKLAAIGAAALALVRVAESEDTDDEPGDSH